MGITIKPKEEKYLKKKKPKEPRRTAKFYPLPFHNIKIYADDIFWTNWIMERFDLALIRIFYREIPQKICNEEIMITDGKSVIRGKRIDDDLSVLTGGYKMKSVKSKEWAEERGFIYAPQYEIRISVDHKAHFIKRYKERKFDLRTTAYFISAVAQCKLGQKVKVFSEDDIVVGVRQDAHRGMLISGMKRGEIDMFDYCDQVFHQSE